jgi:predicted nuclease with TOPRIM domain
METSPDIMELNIKERIKHLNRRKARLDEKLENLRLAKRDYERYIDELGSVEEELFNLEGTILYRRINERKRLSMLC